MEVLCGLKGLDGNGFEEILDEDDDLDDDEGLNMLEEEEDEVEDFGELGLQRVLMSGKRSEGEREGVLLVHKPLTVQWPQWKRQKRYEKARLSRKNEAGSKNVRKTPRLLSVLQENADELLRRGMEFFDRNDAELRIAEYCEAKGVRPTTVSRDRIRCRKDHTRMTLCCVNRECSFLIRLLHNSYGSWSTSHFDPHNCSPATMSDVKERHSRTAYKARHLAPIVADLIREKPDIQTKKIAEHLQQYLHLEPSRPFVKRVEKEAVKFLQNIRHGQAPNDTQKPLNRPLCEMSIDAPARPPLALTGLNAANVETSSVLSTVLQLQNAMRIPPDQFAPPSTSTQPCHVPQTSVPSSSHSRPVVGHINSPRIQRITTATTSTTTVHQYTMSHTNSTHLTVPHSNSASVQTHGTASQPLDRTVPLHAQRSPNLQQPPQPPSSILSPYRLQWDHLVWKDDELTRR